MSTLRYLTLTLTLVSLIIVCMAEQKSKRLQKRLNFNFMRMYQPFDAKPIKEQEVVQNLENNDIAESVVRTPEQRIKSRLLCINALANMAACNDI